MVGGHRRHRFGTGVVHALDVAAVDSAGDVAQIAFLGAREFVAAIENDHGVVHGQRQGVLDGRVTSADHHDGFTAVGIRIVQLILDLGQGIAGHFHAPQIALQTDA